MIPKKQTRYKRINGFITLPAVYLRNEYLNLSVNYDSFKRNGGL